TISTGFVVDDAIVMIEHISRYIELGESPLQAALKGAKQIGFTILSLTVSLVAVLIPLLFMGDIVGRLFREFAITLAVTILVSAVVSLTLTPMMCAKLLRHRPEAQQGRFYRASERAFVSVVARYGSSLQWVLGHQTATLLVPVATLVGTLWPLPGLRDVASDQQNGGLEASLVIDRDTASRLGITPQLIDDTLYDAFGQRQVSTIFTQLNQYHVVLEVDPRYQQNPDAL